MDNPKEREVDRSQFTQWCGQKAQSAVSAAAVAGDALLLVLQTTALRRAPKMATTLREGCYQQHRVVRTYDRHDEDLFCTANN